MDGSDLDGFEVHDCFTPSEYLAIDESWKAVENGEIEIGGRLAINPTGTTATTVSFVVSTTRGS